MIQIKKWLKEILIKENIRKLKKDNYNPIVYIGFLYYNIIRKRYAYEDEIKFIK